MDQIAGSINEKVIMQIGYTDYKPVNAEYFDFEDYSVIQKLTRGSRVVVSHAGAGSIITAFEQKKHIIIVPRLKEFNEIIIDHQFEIANSLSKNKNLTILYNVDNLELCLQSDFSFVDEHNDNRLVDSLKNYLHSLQHSKP